MKCVICFNLPCSCKYQKAVKMIGVIVNPELEAAYKKIMAIKKNCLNCKHLGKEIAQENGVNVVKYTCLERYNDMRKWHGKMFHEKLQSESYRTRHKRCHVTKKVVR